MFCKYFRWCTYDCFCNIKKTKKQDHCFFYMEITKCSASTSCGARIIAFVTENKKTKEREVHCFYNEFAECSTNTSTYGARTIFQIPVQSFVTISKSKSIKLSPTQCSPLPCASWPPHLPGCERVAGRVTPRMSRPVLTHGTRPSIRVMAAAGLSCPYGAFHCLNYYFVFIHIIILVSLKGRLFKLYYSLLFMFLSLLV